MHPISLPVAELKPALAGLSKIINRRSTLPVLGCVRIERTNIRTIEISATDLDSSAIVRLETPTQGDARVILVPMEDLNNITKSCGKNDTLLLSSFDKDKVAIKFPLGGNMIEHTCDSVSPDEFPAIPEIAGEPVVLDEKMRQAIQDAFECASSDQTRLVLNGAYLDTSTQGHYVVGTDGHHLFSSNSFTIPLKESLIIPAHRFLGSKELNGDGDWTLRVNKTNDLQRFEIATGHWRYIARSCEGNFPNWRQVVPDPNRFGITADFDPQAIPDLIRTIARMPDHDAVNHTIGIEVSGRTLSLLGKSANADTWNSIPVSSSKVKGKDVRIFLNRKFLTRALRFGLARLEIIDSMSPMRFGNDGRQMIAMPLRADFTSLAVAPADPPPLTAKIQPNPPPPADIQQNPPPPAEQPKENSTMSETNGNGAATHPFNDVPNTQEKSALEIALAQLEIVRGEFRNTTIGLNKLGETLKQLQREKKANEKEISSVRATIRSLQTVRI